jgi:gas vesicle protein
MRIQDLINNQKQEKARKVKRQKAKNVAIGAGIGAAVGVAAGILLAPDSGKDTREKLAKNAKTAAESAKDSMIEIKGKIVEAKDKVAEFLGKREDESCTADECCNGSGSEDKE